MGEKGQFLSQGNTSEIYEWESGKILKLYRKGLPDRLCLEEFSITKSVYERLQISPEPFETVRIDGRAGAVYEQIQGETMIKSIALKPWTYKKYACMLAQCHARIQIPVDFNLPTVKEKLKKDIKATNLLSDAEKRQLYRYIASLPNGNSLCHFDFHPGNVMVSDGQCRVIDWMTACIGNPLSDTARTVLLLNFAEIPKAPFWVNLLAKAIQKKICKSYLSEYLKLTGAEFAEIQKWELPLAAARLREWIPEGESQKLVRYIQKELSKHPQTEN